MNEKKWTYHRNKIDLAIYYAKLAHAKQKRKYTDEPYFVHCQQVAELVKNKGGTESMIVAAYLHDIVEDTDFTHNSIRHWFGDEVSNLVYWLTDISRPEDGNRKTRKEIDLNHIIKAPTEAKIIKCADLISNAHSIVQHDPDFAKVFLAEMRKILEAFDTKHRLQDIAFAVLENCEEFIYEGKELLEYDNDVENTCSCCHW